MKPTPVLLAHLTLLVVISAPCIAGTREPAATGHTSTAPLESAATMLVRLSHTERANAVLALEALGGTSASSSDADARAVESLWNGGCHEQALHTLQRLESAGARFAPAIVWRMPVAGTEKRWADDVRIGGARTGARDVALDFHRGQGTLFAAVSWDDAWTMNISTDGGETWQETYDWSGSSLISMAVAGDYAWVAYSPNAAWNEVRMRRFHATDGAVDDVYDFKVVADVGTQIIDSLVLISNADDVDSAVYFGFTTTAMEVGFFWDDLSGTSFTEVSPPITDAVAALDLTWNPTTTNGYLAFLSYLSVSDTVDVWRVDLFGSWELVLSEPFAGDHLLTSISAYDDYVLVAYNHVVAEGTGISYQASYDSGSSWSSGELYIPSPGDPPLSDVDVTLRGGLGAAAVYAVDGSASNWTVFRRRPGYSPGPWGDRVTFSDHNAVVRQVTRIEWLGAPCVRSYGAVYLADGNIPYFDLAFERGFFCDGFEAGDTTAWN
jgi:hypothetical protein